MFLASAIAAWVVSLHLPERVLFNTISTPMKTDYACNCSILSL